MNQKTAHTVAMTGATGFVGSRLSGFFQEQGWRVKPIGRRDLQAGPPELAEKIKGADIMVNLAGAPIIGRWTKAYKKVLYDSRITVTRVLVEACSLLDNKPGAFVSTSAIGYYASQGTHTEDRHVRADDFLGHLTRDWEQEALRAGELGIRTVIFRFGVVLGRNGGALKQMLTPFRLGLGGMIGDGRQPFSWIHIQDLLQAYRTVILNSSYKGIYNLTAPNPTTNQGLTRALGRVLSRPVVLNVPKFVLRLKFGEGAQVLTSGQSVIPGRLLESGFSFQFADIDEALRDCVSREDRR